MPARERDEFRILQRVSSAVTTTLDLQEICEIALRTMDDLFEFHHAIVLLREPDGQTLRVAASRGYEGQAIGGRARIGVGVIGVVAERRTLLHVGNLGQQRAYAAAQRRELVKSGRGDELGEAVPIPGLPNAESQIAIPLVSGDDLVGVFSIESPIRHVFDEHDRRLVTIVANQIASAIRNAQLYDERRRAAEALQAANATLEARVADRTAELERELRVAGQLLSDARSRVEGPLLGESAAVRALRTAVASEATRLTPLLLVGPPGAGKEAVAHAVHVASGRPGAFIFLSCPELHTPLRGGPASTGTALLCGDPTVSAKLELAAGGTIFLESVHELATPVQEGLAALVAEHERQRERGETPYPDVRIIASTTRTDLRPGGGPTHRTTRIKGATTSLFEILERRRIDVPALKDRREDIRTLVDYFLRRLSRQFGKVIDGVAPESLRQLELYSWPGNIRELRTVLERAVLVSHGTLVEVGEELLGDQPSIGSYRLESKLGSGGMGEVWLARHRLLARPAAVKLIRPDVEPGQAQEQLVRRFQREAQVTSGLRSPHTVQLYDFGVNDTGGFYYVMELLEGLDLHQVVTRFGPQPAERVVWLLGHACRSLAEAHSRGLVHRDIKPANLFVARLGVEYDYLKVLDFGVVKDQPGPDAAMLTAQGVVQGTPAFIAPEVVFGDRVFDGRADLYSLACAAYWVLTGQPVFPAKAPLDMLVQHAQTTPLPVSRIAEIPIPAQLDAVLLACLEKDPGKRPSSASELERELAAVPFEQPWTAERARTWWEAHAPDIVGPMPAGQENLTPRPPR